MTDSLPLEERQQWPEAVRQALAVLPEQSGVYLMHDAAGKVIYVGKAVVLKNRVRSYFRNLASHGPKVRAMVGKVASIETIVTASEVEALILECNLIKRYRPRYNIMLKDDKAYPYLKLTLQEDYPRLLVVRRQSRDGARYFGPYGDVGAMHGTVRLLRQLFPLRSCRTMQQGRPCLNYHIKRCLAPCAGLISQADYRKLCSQVAWVLEGRGGEVERELRLAMQEAAANLDFEEAARLRDQLAALGRLNQQQQAAASDQGDLDVVGLAQDHSGLCLQLFFVRGGRLLGRDKFFLPLAAAEEGEEEVIAAFLKQYYDRAASLPKQIVLPVLPQPEERELIQRWLSQKRGSKVELLQPQRGTKRELLQLAQANAGKLLEERWRSGSPEPEDGEAAAEELRQALGLERPLRRMDCFDISHTQGRETVASMVVFRNGSSSKKDYRKYKIKSAEGKPDDFKSMQEVVYRRYKDYEDLPDLVVIDGGKGQLSSALAVMQGLGLDDVPVVGLAKREEELFLPHQAESLLLDREGAALHLIQRLRDEAHRFAITFHRKLRSKRNLSSVLDHVEGIGPKRRQELWKRFKTLEQMKAASLEELAAVPAMNRAAAQSLLDFFHLDLVDKRRSLK